MSTNTSPRFNISFPSFIRSKKFWFFAIATHFFILFLLFAPFLWAPSIAQSQVNSPESNRTQLVDFDFVHPQYAVFQKTENYGARVQFVNLSRTWLVWWQPELASKVDFTVPTNLTDGEKKALQNQNLDSLEGGVKSGRLTPNSPNPADSIDELTRNIIDQQTKNQQPGAERFSLQDNSQTHKITIVNGLKYPENSVLLNGKTIPAVKNVFSIQFEQSNDAAQFLYYTDYEVFDEIRAIEGGSEDGYGTVQFSGTIKRYSIQSGTVETVYQSAKKQPISLRANSRLVLFFGADNEGGILNVKTKEMKSVTIPRETSSTSFLQDTLVEVLDIGESSAIIVMRQPNNGTTFRVNLFSGDIQKIVL